MAKLETDSSKVVALWYEAEMYDGPPCSYEEDPDKYLNRAMSRCVKGTLQSLFPGTDFQKLMEEECE